MDRGLEDDQELVAALGRLRSSGAIDEWRIRDQRTSRTELYFVGDSLEAKREVEYRKLIVEVLGQGCSPGAWGYARTVLAPSTADWPAFVAALADGVSQGDNPRRWCFPRPSSRPCHDRCCDERIVARPQELVHELGAAWGRSCAELQRRGVRGGHLELFSSHTRIHVHTEAGTLATGAATGVQLEGTVTSARDERLFSFHGSTLEQLDLPAMVARTADELMILPEATTPKTGSYMILLGHEAVAQLLRAAVDDLQAMAVFRGISKLTPGDRFGPPGLRVEANAPRRGLGRTPIDEEGEPTRPFLLVDDGRVVRLAAPNKYAQLLGVEPSGGLEAIEVGPGPTALAELRARASVHPTLEIVEFSHLFPDAETKDFAAELRFGWLHEHGRRVPVRGGSLRGNVRKLLPSMELAAEVGLDFGNPDLDELPYFGPRAALLGPLGFAGS